MFVAFVAFVTSAVPGLPPDWGAPGRSRSPEELGTSVASFDGRGRGGDGWAGGEARGFALDSTSRHASCALRLASR